MFLNYSWQDQDAVAQPLMQLPAPDWVEHARIPGRITSQLSLRQIAPDTRHRDMRVEGWNANGDSGYWQKDLADAAWHFVVTGNSTLGEALPKAGVSSYEPEDAAYAGSIDGHAATLENFNPYCSPARLSIDINGNPLKLILHSSDGLRQERRARGLDSNPHMYRSAVEVPRTTWDQLAQQPAAVQAFISRYFGSQRFLTGPLSATPGTVAVQIPCWKFTRPSTVTDLPTYLPDPGIDVAEIKAQQQEARGPAACH